MIYGVGIGMQSRPSSAALPVIIALTVVNCGFLIGAAVCMARVDVRLRFR